MSTPPIIEIQALSKRYRLGSIGATSVRDEFLRFTNRLRGISHPDPLEFWALRDLSFAIQPGEVVGFIGRNGAGKSTLLKILSRITEPTAGRAVVRGRIASLLEVGTGFHPDLSGRENIYLNGAILGMTRAEVRRKFDEIVAFGEIGPFIDTPVKRYSSGMYVRLAFAVAAHLEPEILIVDEVLAVGDAAFQRKCLNKIQDVSSQHGRTVLFVSHNLDSVLRLCSRAVWLTGGTLTDDGDPARVVKAYGHQSVTKAGTVSFADRPRSEHLRGKIRVEALAPAGAAWTFPFGSRLGFTVQLRSQVAPSHLWVSYAIVTTSGFEVASNRFHLEPRGVITGPGLHTVDIDLGDFHLAPGFYYLNIGVGSEAGDEDHLTEAALLEVTVSAASASCYVDTLRAVVIPAARAAFGASGSSSPIPAS